MRMCCCTVVMWRRRPDGEQLLQAMSELTGADIAASDDPSGRTEGRADWDLEYQTGDIEVASLLDGARTGQWQGALGSITVTTTADQVDGDADLSSLAALALAPGADNEVSLREAILAANALPDVDTIFIDAGTIALSGGELEITNPLTISGAGSAETIIDETGGGRHLFYNNAGLGSSLSGVSLINGDVSGKGGAISILETELDISDVVFSGNYATDDGGAIYINSTVAVTISDSTFFDNRSDKDGGAVYSETGFTIDNTVFEQNTALSDGGAIKTKDASTLLSITDSWFLSNQASSEGGAIRAESQADITGSLFELNTASKDGGALWLRQASTISNTTFYQNVTSESGGGVYVQHGSADVAIDSSTFVGNTAALQGGGLGHDSSGTVSIKNTLFADNVASGTTQSVDGTVDSLGFNLLMVTPAAGFNSLASDIVGVDPDVGPLQDNGGKLKSVGLNAGSAAIDAGSSTVADARGMTRNEIADIGAFEAEASLNQGKFYWTDQSDNSIYRSNIDGTAVQQIYVSTRPAPNYIIDIEADLTNGHLYFVEADDPQTATAGGFGRIVRINLDGTGETEILTGLLMPMGLALDVDNGYLYFTEDATASNNGAAADTIKRLNLADDTVSTIYSVAGGSSFVDVDYLASSNSLVWSDKAENASDAEYSVHDLDAGTTDTTGVSSALRPYGITATGNADLIYWAANDNIVVRTPGLNITVDKPIAGGGAYGIARLDGNEYFTDSDGQIFEYGFVSSTRTDLVSYAGSPVGLAVFETTTVEAGPTLVTNNPLSVPDEGSEMLSASQLTATDPNTNAANIQYTVTGQTPAAGTFLDVGSNPVTVFTQQQINDGEISFVHNGTTDGVYAISFDVTDGTTALTGNTLTVNVLTVNDPPSGADDTIVIAENGAHTFSQADFGFSDPADGDDLLEVNIDTVPTAGTLMNGLTAVNDGDTIAVADITSLVYTPVADANGAGYSTLTFRVRDNGGTANGGVDTDQTANTLTFDVTSINDAPAGSDDTITIAENGAHTFSVADFGFSDAADGDALQAVIIDTVPTVGTLMNGLTAVNDGDTIAVADITSLVYTPVADANGTGYSTLTFRVRDDGGTASGGVDTDQTANTLTFDVTSINDAPAGSDDTITIAENGAHTFSVADFGFSDAADGDALQAVIIDTVPTVGTLMNGLTAVNDG